MTDELKPETWWLKAKIRSGVLLISEDHDIFLKDNPPHHLEIRLGKPERIEQPIFPSQALCVRHPHWVYDVTVEFTASDESEARLKGWDKLDSLVAWLSFLGSAPVLIDKRGRITNCPEVPIKGKQYVDLIHAEELIFVGENPPTITEDDLKGLPQILLADFKNGTNEHVARSLHWLRRSHFATTVDDQFALLMLAFEAVSPVLKGSPPKCWKCKECKNEIKQCPNCGESTESQASGNAVMEWFVCDMLGWPREKWKHLWKLRNRILHGGRTTEQDITKHLPEIETAVLAALRARMTFSDDLPPKRLRDRGQLFGGELRIEYTWP